MAGDYAAAKDVVLSGTFYNGGKRLRITLTTKNISWVSEQSQEPYTIVPLSELLAVTPCDCLNDHQSSDLKCHHCSLSRYHMSRSLSELLPLHAQSLRLHYAVPVGKHDWKLKSKVFHPTEGPALREWISVIHNALSDLNRVKKLLVFVNPYCGKKKSVKIYEDKVSPIFHLAGIDTHVIVTQRANHAKEMIQDIDIYKFDGIVSVGGEGMLNEVVNGLLLRTQKEQGIDVNDFYNSLVSPSIPIGIIPTGSTNAAINSVSGSNDPVTSALHIVMGGSVGVDICSVHHQGKFLRYAVTFVSYGFCGDVVIDSEKLRWMGPKRYDVAGVKKFFGRKLYDGELQLQVSVPSDRSSWEDDRCRVGCSVCREAGEKARSVDLDDNSSNEGKTRWLTIRGRFIAVNAAIVSCACNMSPAGISPSQHIGNGYCDVIIVSACSRTNYLRYLCRTLYQNKNPFDLDFVQVYRVKEFLFNPYVSDDKTPTAGCTGVQENLHQMSSSVWDCDGEIITEPSIHARIHCQLINVFGKGFEERQVESPYSNCFGFFKKK